MTTSADDIFDLLIIGGGVNGCGLAAQAAMQGYRVMLVDKDDFGAHTSSASSKMIHGGLRYLEQGHFSLVAESLRERAALQKLAPHLIRPLPLVLPVGDGARPLWLLRIGLLLYDWLSRKGSLPRSETLTLGDRYPLRPDYHRGIRYWDCQVDDSRLVLTNALAAREHGASVHNYTACSAAVTDANGWRASLTDRDGVSRDVHARILVNAAGPWVNSVDALTLPDNRLPRVRLVKGSHLVLNRIYDGDDAFLLQHTDGRVVFCLPWLDDYTLFGTTDVDYNGDADNVAIEADEISYLKAVFQCYFGRDIDDTEIVSTFAGVRSLVDDGDVDPRKASRESRIEVSIRDGNPLVSLYGGKLTTYRALAMDCMQRIHALMAPPHKTVETPLPGGDIESIDRLDAQLDGQYPWLPLTLRRRYARAYGSRTLDLLRGCGSLTDLGADFGHGLYAREVDWMIDREWAINCDDILWRRSKLGLRFDAQQLTALTQYLRERGAAARD